MMHRIIFILFTAISFISKATNTDSIVAKLISLEYNYFLSNDEKVKTSIAFEKLNLKLTDSTFTEELTAEIERIDPEYLSHESKIKFYWNSTIVYYLKKEFFKSVYYIEKYNEIIHNKSINELLLYYLILTKTDVQKSINILNEIKIQANNSKVEKINNDSLLKCLSCMTEINHVKNLNKKIKLISSAIVPGSGLILNGNLLKGLTATSVNGLSAYFIYYLITKENYVNAFGWGFSMWLKFYSGNLKLTEKSIDIKRELLISDKAKTCENQLKLILSHYPINYIL